MPGFEIPREWKSPNSVDFYHDGKPVFQDSWKDGNNLWAPGIMVLKANGIFTQEVRTEITKKLYLKATYSTDGYARRNTTGQPKKSMSDIALMGCSYTFGDGVSDSETISSYLQKLNPKMRVLNLGIQGTDASMWLYKVRQNDFAALHDLAPDTQFIYTFIDDHIRRAIGTMTHLGVGPYSRNFPAFVLKDGAVTFKGTMADKFGLWFPVLSFFSESKALEFFNFDFPILDESSVDLQVALIKEIRTELKNKFPASQFSVVIYPYSLRFGPSMVEKLKESGISVFDFSQYDFRTILKGQDTKEDNHPSALANNLLAFLLQKKILNPAEPSPEN